MMDKKFFQIISAACLLAIVSVVGFQAKADGIILANKTDCSLKCETESLFCEDQYIDKFLGSELKSHKEKCDAGRDACISACKGAEDLSMDTHSL